MSLIIPYPVVKNGNSSGAFELLASLYGSNVAIDELIEGSTFDTTTSLLASVREVAKPIPEISLVNATLQTPALSISPTVLPDTLYIDNYINNPIYALKYDSPSGLASSMVLNNITLTGDINIFFFDNVTPSYQNPNPVYTMDWYDVGVSADGSKMLAVDHGGKAWISTNYGNAWSLTFPVGTDTTQNYWCCACSSDFTVLAVGIYGSYIYVSEDSGATWSSKSNASTLQGWDYMNMNQTGDGMLACNGYYIHYTGNTGTSWSTLNPVGSGTQNWKACALSNDKTKMVAGYGNAGRLYYSHDTGATWTETRPEGDVNKDWQHAACNASGSIFLACQNNGRIFISTDSGVNFTETTPLGYSAVRSWYGAFVSNDGNTLMALAYNTTPGYCLFKSIDGGASWRSYLVSNEPVYSTNRLRSFGCSADGTFPIVGEIAGRSRLFVGTVGYANKTTRPAKFPIAMGLDWSWYGAEV